jgi:hypothetical protein
LGADKGYDTRDFVQVMREMDARPNVTQNVNRPGGRAIDTRTTRHAGYEISQKKGPLIERVFGWMQALGPMRKVKLRGRDKLWWLMTLGWVDRGVRFALQYRA